VKIEWRTTGGVAYFPGLAAPVVVDTADLPDDRRATLERLVAEAKFFDQPAEVGSRRGADYQVHTITITDETRTHTIRVSEPIADPALAALVKELRQLKAARQQPPH
jgi:hypothetical protein